VDSCEAIVQMIAFTVEREIGIPPTVLRKISESVNSAHRPIAHMLQKPAGQRRTRGEQVGPAERLL
jgi:hypothetical protein